MSWFSDATGINWDIGASLNTLVKTPAQIITNTLEGKNVFQTIGDAFTKDLGALVHLTPVGLIGDDQKINQALRTSGVNQLTFGLSNDLAGVGTVSSKLSTNTEVKSSEWGEAGRFFGTVAGISSGIGQIGAPATLAEGLQYYGGAQLANSAIKRGDYLGAATALAPSFDLPQLPSLPSEYTQPAEDIWNAINQRQPSGGGSKAPVLDDPWRWRGEPEATAPEAQGASSMPWLFVGVAIVAMVAMKGRR